MARTEDTKSKARCVTVRLPEAIARRPRARLRGPFVTAWVVVGLLVSAASATRDRPSSAREPAERGTFDIVEIAPPPARPTVTIRRRAPGATEQPPPPPAGAKAKSAPGLADALRAAGRTEGIAAFPPPGTERVKGGIVVPDDFELPEGYVRHHQVTDESESLPAILMFSPDYEFVDAGGRPIPLPADMIVPPELAPPGLPLRVLNPGSRSDAD